MRLNPTALLFVLLPFALFATQRDETNYSEMEGIKPSKSSKVDSITIEPVDTADSLQITLSPIKDKEDDIPVDVNSVVSFDLNELPLDESLYRHHVSKLQFEIPMDYNELVKKQIDFFGTRWQDKLKIMVTKSQYVFPIYEEILAEYNMPLEIKYLSIIESGLNPYARSHSGAVGAWQFMPATGKEYDLIINNSVDERRSLEKSTRAACSYLKQMYAVYGDWLVALASYNCGPGNVRKAIRLSGSTNFWGIYPYLPRETQNYVPKFIAMAYIMNFHSEYCITPVPYDATSFLTQKVYCDEGLNFKIIADKLEISTEELLRFNPELKVASIPYKGNGYLLHVPENKVHLFYLNQCEIIESSKTEQDSASVEIENNSPVVDVKKPKIIYYTVKSGDNLQKIATRNHVTITQLRKWNGIKGSTIHPKQRLKIYK
jgi:membrane-bound lytic murein transglycosylase D